jgi:hypothetical protein
LSYAKIKMKRFFKFSPLVLIFFLIAFFYELYLGQNTLALILNQGTDVPGHLEDIHIKRRRGLRNLFYNSDTYGSATCITTKKDMAEWLKTAQFGLIHCEGDSAGKVKFFFACDSLPDAIVNNKIQYTIQLKVISTNSRLVNVTPIDAENVALDFEMDWN